jgi:MSHA biogenesis protein MshE
MTGHMVFSTLHTVSAAATVSRLRDMGAPGYLLAAALSAIVAQRLVRRVCNSCKEPAQLSDGQRAWLNAQVGVERVAGAQFMRGRGCNYCFLTGYRGRIGVYELLEMDPQLTAAIQREDLAGSLKAVAKKDGYVTLGQRVLDYALAGITSIEEAIRIAGGPDEDIDAIGAEQHTDIEPTCEA